MGFIQAIGGILSEDHASVPVPSLYYGLKAVFKDYPIKKLNEQSLETIKKHYEEYLQKNKVRILPSEDLVRNAGLYQQYAKRDLSATKTFYEYNYKNYPDSWKAWYSLASFLPDLDELDRAKAQLKECLKLNPQAEEAKQLLKQLK